MSKKVKEVNKEKKLPKFGGYNQRYYPLPDGRELVSVTTVLSILNKPALIQWSANCSVNYIREHALANANLTSGYYMTSEEMLLQAKTAHRRISKEAADTGTDAHSAILIYLTDHNYDASKWNEQTQKSFDAFMEWYQKHNVKVIATEVIVYGEDYAGRFDLLAEVDGLLTLIDIKTSKDFYPEMPLQLAAYRYAHDLPNGEKMNLPLIQAMGILRIDKETGIPDYRDFSKDYEKYLEAFMCLVKFWNITERKDE